MELQKINPFIRYCNIYPQPILYPEMVQSYDCRIFYVLHGNGTFFINDKQYDFHQDSIIYFPCGTKYRFFYDKNDEIKFLILNFDLTSEYSHLSDFFSVDTICNFNYKKMVTVPDCDHFTKPIYMHKFPDAKKDLMTIQMLFVNKPFLYSEQASGLLKKLLLQMISTRYIENKSNSSRLTEQVLSYIRTHYTEPLTNQMIAEAFGFHSYYLNRIVKNECGQNMHNYLLQYRIKEAQNLLSTSAFSIQHISKIVGFGTPAQFSAAFKKNVGISPNEYRENSHLSI